MKKMTFCLPRGYAPMQAKHLMPLAGHFPAVGCGYFWRIVVSRFSRKGESSVESVQSVPKRCYSDTALSVSVVKI